MGTSGGGWRGSGRNCIIPRGLLRPRRFREGSPWPGRKKSASRTWSPGRLVAWSVAGHEDAWSVAWLLPGVAWSLPGVAWSLPGRCLVATWSPPGRLPGRCLVAAWSPPGRRLVATWSLPGCHLVPPGRLVPTRKEKTPCRKLPCRGFSIGLILLGSTLHRRTLNRPPHGKP